MLQSKIGRNFLILFILLNMLMVASFGYAVLKQPDLLGLVLPGQFGPTASPDLSGNLLFYALLLGVNAALFMVFGFGGTWHALWAGLRVSPRKLRWLLHERVSLASDIAGVVAAAVQEEEKDEISYVARARGFLTIGLLTVAVALPALCLSYTRAAPDGPAIFERDGQAVANDTVTEDTILRFTVDQLAGGLLLDVPEIFHLRATPTETNGANIMMGVAVVLYRALIGFGVLLWFVGMRRAGDLRSYAMQTAMRSSEIVAMEPILQDGHGHYAHDRRDWSGAAAHDEHGHHGPTDHGHGHDDEHHEDDDEAAHETHPQPHDHDDHAVSATETDASGHHAKATGHEPSSPDHGHSTDHAQGDAHGDEHPESDEDEHEEDHEDAHGRSEHDHDHEHGHDHQPAKTDHP